MHEQQVGRVSISRPFCPVRISPAKGLRRNCRRNKLIWLVLKSAAALKPSCLLTTKGKKGNSQFKEGRVDERHKKDKTTLI